MYIGRGEQSRDESDTDSDADTVANIATAPATWHVTGVANSH